MKEQRHRILCAVCALALVLTAVLAPAAWAADGAGEVQDTAKPTLTTDDAAEMQQADAAAAKAPEVDTGAASSDTSTTRKRARFQSPGSTIQSVSI